jgi:hypothetical protein
MAETARQLHQLVHDVRGPLGIASGYLRLLQDGKIPDAADQRAAIAKALDALGRIDRLCEVVVETDAASR